LKKSPKKKEHKRETSESSKRQSVPSGKRESISSKRDFVPPKSESVTIIPNIISPLATPKYNLSPLTSRNQPVEQLPPNHRASRKDCNCILCLYENNQKSKTVLHNKENMPILSPSDTGKLDQPGSSEMTFEELQQTLKEMYSVNLISI